MRSPPRLAGDASPSSGPRPVTPAYLDRAAVHYLERFSSSAENLRRVLARKARRRLGPDAPPDSALDAAIAETVARAVRSGLVDDRSFATSKVGALARKGTSPRAMRLTLAAKGVAAETAAAAIADEAPDALALARRHAERKRLGPYRLRPDPAMRARDLAALCRAGFPYRVAVEALNEPENEPD